MKTINIEGYDVSLHVNTYVSNKTVMALTATDVKTGEPFACLSVNLGDDIGNGSRMQYGSTFLDTNNCPGVCKALEDAGIAQPYMRFGSPVTKPSGFCEYPLYEFDMNKLSEYVPQSELDTYKDTYVKAFSAPRQMPQGFDMPGGFSRDDIAAGLDL